jgi:hypothetical protein
VLQQTPPRWIVGSAKIAPNRAIKTKLDEHVAITRLTIAADNFDCRSHFRQGFDGDAQNQAVHHSRPALCCVCTVTIKAILRSVRGLVCPGVSRNQTINFPNIIEQSTTGWKQMLIYGSAAVKNSVDNSFDIIKTSKQIDGPPFGARHRFVRFEMF